MDAIPSAQQPELTKVRITGLFDRLAHGDRPMSRRIPAVEMSVPDREETGTVKPRLGRSAAAFDRRQGHDRFENAARRIHPGDRTVEERLVLVGREPRIFGGRTQGDRVKTGRARHRQHVAVARVEEHRRTAPAFQLLLDHGLDARLDRQGHVFARDRFEHLLLFVLETGDVDANQAPPGHTRRPDRAFFRDRDRGRTAGFRL